MNFYAWLTIATTKDLPLLTNSANSTLPFVPITAPIVGFYFFGPILLLFFCVYFHLYLQRLWERLAKLPAIFPDGDALDEKIYPWLLTGFVRRHVTLLRTEPRALSGLQTSLAVLLAWWLVPITLLVFWWRYLCRHDLIGTTLHVLLFVLSAAVAIGLQGRAAATLRGEESKTFVWRAHWKQTVARKENLALLFVGILFSVVSLSAIYNYPLFVPRALMHIGLQPFVDLQEMNVSTKPANWTGLNAEEFHLIKGAKLKGRNLRGAILRDAFLAKADLREADLQGADLTGTILAQADFQGANLAGLDLTKPRLFMVFPIEPYGDETEFFAYSFQGAKLQGVIANGIRLRGTPDFRDAKLQGAYLKKTYLEHAQLQKADLQGAHLQEAYLSGADLREANLSGADLREANLQSAYLQGAHLKAAVLQKASLRGANLQDADLREVKGLTLEQMQGAQNWVLAYYSSDLLKLLKLPPDHNERARNKEFEGADFQGLRFEKSDLRGTNLRQANLQNAELSSADLREADLRGANLQNAILFGADLRKADLRGANLQDVKFLGGVQKLLSAIKILFIFQSIKIRQQQFLNTTVASAPLCRRDQRPMLAVGRKHAVKSRQIHARLRHQRGQARNEIQRLKDHLRGAVSVRRLELVTDVAIRRE